MQSKHISVLEAFGKAVLDYFLMNNGENSYFRLSVNDYTFTNCVDMAGIEEEKLIQCLQRKETIFSNSLEALAIAAYQVKIAGDILSVSKNRNDAYYQKVMDNYPQYAGAQPVTIMKGYFEGCQDNLWQSVQRLFRENKRNLIIPDEKTGKGRYVQYPLEAQVVSNTRVLKYADIFISRGLKPFQQNLSYEQFCRMFFHYYEKEAYRRTIWQFYCDWNGRSYREIIDRTRGHYTDKLNSTNEYNVLLEIDDQNLTFYDQYSSSVITNYEDIQSFIFSNKHKIYFKSFDDCELYEPSDEPIEADSEIVIISKNAIQVLENNEQRFEFKFGNISLFVYQFKISKKICEFLGLSIQPLPLPIKLIGGIKKRNGHYYLFGLPAVKFGDGQDKVILNSKEISIKDNILYLDDFRKELKAFPKTNILKLPDYIPLKFQIDKRERETGGSEQVDYLGWACFNDCIIPHSNSDEKKIIQGFTANFDFTSLYQKTVPSGSERPFITKLNKYKNRFEINRFNEQLTKRSK